MIERIFRNQFDHRSENIWLTIYADIITNLMLVFLALYGLSVMGSQAISDAMESMRLSRYEEKVIPAFNRVAPALQDTIGNVENVSIVHEAGAVRVQFGESVLFPSGSASLKNSAYDSLLTVGALLKVLPYTIVIEGHTDSQPLIKNSRYKDNYELSLARSMAVLRMLVDQAGIPEAQLASAAYGEYRPIAQGQSVSANRLNRRVEIAIFRDFPYPNPSLNQSEGDI